MNSFGYLILYLTIFVVIFLINSFFINSLRGFNKHFKNILETITLIGFGIALEILFDIYISKYTFYVLPIITLIIVFFNLKYCWILPFIAMIIFYVTYYASNQIYFLISATLLILIVSYFLNFLKWKKKIVLLINFLILFAIEVLRLIFYEKNFDFLNNILQWSFILCGCIGIKLAIQSILDSANSLYQNSLFTYSSYYRSAKFIEKALEFIEKNKIEIATIGLVEFSTEMKSLNEEQLRFLEEYKNKTLDNIKQLFKTRLNFLFQANEHNYGFMLPISFTHERFTNYEDHIWYRTIITKLESIQQVFDQKIMSIGPKVSFGFSVYGVDSGDLYRLVSNCEFALRSKNEQPEAKYYFYDPNKYQERISDGTQIAKLNQIIQLNLIFPAYFSVYNYKKRKTIFHIADVAFDILASEEQKIINLLKKIDLWGTTLRYVAAKSLRNFSPLVNNAKIAIHYDANFINSNSFQVEKFYNRILANFIKKEQLIVFLDSNQNIVDKEFWQKIRKMQQMGITIGVENVGSENMNLEFIQKLRPTYMNLSPKLFHFKGNEIDWGNIFNVYKELARKLKSTIIFTKINTFTELQIAIKHNIYMIGGPIFENYKFSPQNFTKQSKIYIDEIIQGR